LASDSHSAFWGCFTIKDKEINLVISASSFTIDIES
jgi:hypothetical protein